MLCRPLGSSALAWTDGSPLPGGDMAGARFTQFADAFAQRHSWLPPALAYRYARAYGTRAARVLGRAQSLAGLGAAFAPGLYEAEVRYLRDVEWATCAEDVLWRRSKLGLHVAPETLEAVTAAIDAWFAAAGAITLFAKQAGV